MSTYETVIESNRNEIAQFFRVRIPRPAPILTFELTLVTEEVRDLWQVRVGEIYFGISQKFTLVFR